MHQNLVIVRLINIRGKLNVLYTDRHVMAGTSLCKTVKCIASRSFTYISAGLNIFYTCKDADDSSFGYSEY